MKAIMVMFDSLNRHMLPPYGCDWVHAPNFQRLAERTVTFDRSFVGSMPCMPARRELHTGRLNFLHRSWGPLEPFDDSMPEILKARGTHTHLISDHYHYWEEGGCTYHTRYNNWEIARGHEGDPWKADLNEPKTPHPNRRRGDNPWMHQDWVNRGYMQDEAQMPQAKTFAMGLEFLECNHQHDNWFLQLETFDPHEPYFVPQRFKDLYDHDFSQFDDDWPGYAPVTDETRELIPHMRFLNAALISMCDHYLGTVLDKMDALGLWDDTMLIVNTDHGFLLGEHDWWAKCRMPFYNEIAHTPLFIWDPRSAVACERRQSLVQTIDLAPTLLEFFGAPIPDDMMGVPLRDTITDDTPVRDACLFGLFGGHVNCTDGNYVYMRAPEPDANRPLFNYTLMPTHMRHTFPVEELKRTQLHGPFSFTKGCPVMQIDATPESGPAVHDYTTALFDISRDPSQQQSLDAPDVERTMRAHLVALLRANDAPPEQFERLGLTGVETGAPTSRGPNPERLKP